MDNEISKELTVKKAFFTVTPFSKYLAMILFVVSPFLGGLVAYTMIPPQVVTVLSAAPPQKQTITQQPVKEEGAISRDYIHSLDDVKYYTVKYYLTSSSELYKDVLRQVSPGLSLKYPDANNLKDLPEETRVFIVKVSEERFKVFVGLTTKDYNNYHNFFLFERNTGSSTITLLSTLDDRLNADMPEQWMSVSDDVFSPEYQLIRIEGSENSYVYPDSLVLYDFQKNTRNVLYKETNPNVQIAAGCELGCGGILSVGMKSVIFCQYERINGSYDTKFIECKEINIP